MLLVTVIVLVQENNRKKNIKSKVCILQAAIIG